MIKPKVLVVDDEPSGRYIAQSLEKDFGFSVCFPQDPRALDECLSTETFDSALIDVNLTEGRWKNVRHGTRISGTMVKSGKDIKRIARKLNAQLPTYTYTTGANVRGDVFRIRKPINPRSGKLLQALQEVEGATREHFQEVGPPEIYYRQYKSLTFNERLQRYKEGLSVNAKEFKERFHVLGNVSWLLLANKKVRLCGESLDGNAGPAALTKMRYAKIPTATLIRKVAKESRVFPSPFWNTNTPAYLKKQFDLAGPGLINYCPMIRELFSVSVAYSCGETFIEGLDARALDRCGEITSIAKIYLSKLMFKYFGGSGHRGFSRYVRASKKLTLPKIVEIYTATVDRIDKKNSAAWVELRKYGDDRIALVEPFDLRELKAKGVQYENQTFEYTVVRWPTTEHPDHDIELTRDEHRPQVPFPN
jgi:CheY-like chemotaxis protein